MLPESSNAEEEGDASYISVTEEEYEEEMEEEISDPDKNNMASSSEEMS